MPAEIPVKTFANPKAWETWLHNHHTDDTGLWLRLFKKASGRQTMTYDEALDIALCYGWIDGQKNAYDEQSWIQKFTPRRRRSLWSRRNIEHVARLTKAKRMQPSGLAQVKAAKADGRWDRAYDTSTDMTIPADFLKELQKDKKAHAFFLTLNKANTYAIAWRLQTATKPETRARRMQVILEKMKKGEKLH